MTPRFFTFLLRTCLPKTATGLSVLGDLHEEFERRDPGLVRALWYAATATQLALGFAFHRALGALSWRPVGSRPRASAGALFDAKQAVRALVKRPGYTVTAALTLTLGIGLTTSIYSVVDAVMIRPLPYQRPGELVTVWNTYPTWRGHEILDRLWDRIWLSWPEYVDWRDGQDLFGATAIYGQSPMTLTGRGRPTRTG